MRIWSLCWLGGWLVAGRAAAAGNPPAVPAAGRLVWAALTNAPFPHPARAQGHTYGGKEYSAAEHYQNNTVALFVPPGFQPADQVDFVVHFHGWHNQVTNVLAHYELPRQFTAGGRNAILVVPQGPFMAPDSFDGKLEEPNGFARFMDEVMATLRERQVIPASAGLGRIALAGHSGGYAVISSILAQGGLTGHIHEVWLYDALYGRTPKFMTWFDHDPRARLVNLYTDHGGTKEETEKLLASRRAAGQPLWAGGEAALTPGVWRTNRLLFIHTPLEHDAVPVGHDAFARCLESCELPGVGGGAPGR